jgi:hypothetical protein
MNQLPIMYFQVGATAIPTLLIAVAVGIKHGAAYASYYEQVKGWPRFLFLVITVVTGLAVALGEFAALRAIARGSGNQLEGEMVWSAISLCLLLIVMELVEPFAEKMERRNHKNLMLGIVGVWMVMCVYVSMISTGVIPL